MDVASNSSASSSRLHFSIATINFWRLNLGGRLLMFNFAGHSWDKLADCAFRMSQMFLCAGLIWIIAGTTVSLIALVGPTASQDIGARTGARLHLANLDAFNSHTTKWTSRPRIPATIIADNPHCTAGVATCEDYGCSTAGKSCQQHWDQTNNLSCTCE